MKDDLIGMARVAEGMVRAGPIRHLPEVLTALGLRVEPLLDAARLPRDILASPENVLSVAQAAALMALCARRSGRAHFGLLAGQKAELAHYGLIGLQMQHAATVGSAWRGLILTLHLNGRAVVPSLVVRDRVAILSFAPYGVEEKGYVQLLDFTIAAACSVMRQLCGPHWTPSEVRFSHRAPADMRPYKRFFMAPLRFGSAQTALLFPAAGLERRIRTGNVVSRKVLQAAMTAMLQREDIDLVSKVRRALFMKIAQDDVSIDGVSQMLGLHKRTLNRRLAEHGTTFARQLGEVRFHLARQLLAQTDLSLVDLAATLGYADMSAFSRAFRGWAGQAPIHWRQTYRAETDDSREPERRVA